MQNSVSQARQVRVLSHYVDVLKKAGFNLLCLANNHIMDRGEQGILNTLENCRKLGVDTVGAFKTANERDKIYVKISVA